MKKTKRGFAALLAAVVAAACIPSVALAADDESEERLVYQSSENFSTASADGTWDGGVWSAQIIDPNSSAAMMITGTVALRDGLGENAEPAAGYQTADGGHAVSAYRILPSPRNTVENFAYSAAKVFTAPRTGSVTISCGGDKIQTTDGSGPSVRIRKLSGGTMTQVWPSSGSEKLGWAAYNGKHDDIKMTLKEGDKLYFEGMRNTNGKDHMWTFIYWDPIVTYAPTAPVVQRDVYRSSEFFSIETADGTWDGGTWSAQIVDPDGSAAEVITGTKSARDVMGAETSEAAAVYQTADGGQAVSAYRIAPAPRNTVENYGYSSAKVFKAPRSGVVTISCGGGKIQTNENSHPSVRIRKLSNGTMSQVWPSSGSQRLDDSSMNAAHDDITLYITKGEKIFFEGLRNTNKSDHMWTHIYWDPIVTYAQPETAVQRDLYQSSEYFSTEKIDGSWDHGVWSAQIIDPNGSTAEVITGTVALRGGMGENAEEAAAYQTADGGQAVSAYRIAPSPRNTADKFEYSAAKVFKAPRTGSVTISCGGDKIQTSDGSGPSVRIRKLSNGKMTQVWPASGSQKLGWAAYNGKHDDIKMTLNEGDKLYFEGLRNTNGKDHMWTFIYWDPIVEYDDALYIEDTHFENADGETVDDFAEITAADNSKLCVTLKINKADLETADAVTVLAAVYDANGTLVGIGTASADEVTTDGVQLEADLGQKTNLTSGKIRLLVFDSMSAMRPVISTEYTNIISK